MSTLSDDRLERTMINSIIKVYSIVPTLLYFGSRRSNLDRWIESHGHFAAGVGFHLDINA